MIDAIYAKVKFFLPKYGRLSPPGTLCICIFGQDRLDQRLVCLFVLVVGPISTAAMKAYCTVTPDGVPLFISRGAAHQAA
jgi:hypothetical protein